MQRIIIVALAILISLPVVIKSRVSGINPAPAAFSIVSSGARLVQISGDVRQPGVYSVSANTLTGDAIKLAVPVSPIKRLHPIGIDLRPIAQGEHLQLTIREDDTGTISFGVFSPNQRIILGIPLDINSMSISDFDLLPGIGPVVAQRIIEYRQKNGGKMRLDELQNVEGIGESKYNAIKQYF